MIDTIDEMWKATGGPEKTRVKRTPGLTVQDRCRGEGPPPGPFPCARRLAAIGAAAVAGGRWLDVVEVRGRSMAPTLLPGDRLLVEA